MSSCKDCVHYEVCGTKRFKEVNENAYPKIQYKCDHFQPKSRIVELPCEVGGKVYIISRNKVKECEVVFVGISADERCSHFNFVENYADGTFRKSYSMVFEVIGKTVFLTREEAEKALKERKKE